MHHAVLTLFAAGVHEKSKTAFYVLGGTLAAWAVIVSAVGFTRPDFPGERGGARVVIAISTILVLGAMSSAVLTASTPPPAGTFKPHHAGYAKGTAPAPTPVGQAATGTQAAKAPSGGR